MKPLSIAIVTRIEKALTIQDLVPILERLGHTVVVYDISNVRLDTFLKNDFLKKLAAHDLVYYRIGADPEVATCIEKYLKAAGTKCIYLNFFKHPHITAKTYQVLKVAEAGFKVPVTLYNQFASFDDIASQIGSPFVAKANRSAQGKEVNLIRNQSDLDVIANQREPLQYFFQEYIPHRSDYRVHVVGGKAWALYQRIPAPGDFRGNVSQGASMLRVEDEFNTVLADQAISVAGLFGFEITGVDFMRHAQTGDFYFTEINLSPGWFVNVKEVTGVDLSEIVAKYLEECCQLELNHG